MTVVFEAEGPLRGVWFLIKGVSAESRFADLWRGSEVGEGVGGVGWLTSFGAML